MKKKNLPVVTETITSPMLNVLSFLSTIMKSDHEYTKLEISEAADVSYPTLLRLWPAIEELKLVIPTRRLGPAQLFNVNKGSSLIRKFAAFELELAAMLGEKIVAEELVGEEFKRAKATMRA
ncbi:MAG: hypothetical protein QMD00_04555 [Hadesarchaea archaeon]|nr:hypothetical protein [Hadesarchaea archaeon]